MNSNRFTDGLLDERESLDFCSQFLSQVPDKPLVRNRPGRAANVLFSVDSEGNGQKRSTMDLM